MSSALAARDHTASGRATHNSPPRFPSPPPTHVPPPLTTKSPLSSARASGVSSSLWMTRRTGRPPNTGSNPFAARYASAAGLTTCVARWDRGARRAGRSPAREGAGPGTLACAGAGFAAARKTAMALGLAHSGRALACAVTPPKQAPRAHHAHALLLQARHHAPQPQPHNVLHLLGAQRLKDDELVHAVDELGAKVLAHLRSRAHAHAHQQWGTVNGARRAVQRKGDGQAGES